MSTLTIELPDDLAARLEAASEQSHVPPAQLVRAALEKALPSPVPDWPADGPSLHERMKDFVGCINSGVTDLATNLPLSRPAATLSHAPSGGEGRERRRSLVR